MKSTYWVSLVSFIIAAVGFLLPFWPLTAVGVLLAALSGRWFFAILLGLLIDVAYGAPVGRFYFLYVPFTLLAVVGALARYFFAGRFRQAPSQHLE